jgi:hypothetical protein
VLLEWVEETELLRVMDDVIDAVEIRELAELEGVF